MVGTQKRLLAQGIAMLLAILSDSHLRAPSPWFEAVYERYLAGADHVFHCGDHVGHALWTYLLQHPGFESVAGNSDGYDLAAELPPLLERDIAGRRLAVTHGWGPRPGLSARLAKAFAHRYDILFFGHSHTAEDTRHGTTRYINPGACQPGGSLALVDCDDSRFDVRFVDL